MIYKIITMGGQAVRLRSEEALAKFLAEANAGKKLVLTEFGVVNVASIDSIVPDNDANNRVHEMLGYREVRDGKQVPQYTLKQAEDNVAGTSPFAKLLGNKMKMLTDAQRTESQEETGRLGRGR